MPTTITHTLPHPNPSHPQTAGYTPASTYRRRQESGHSIASISKGRIERTARNAMCNTSTDSAEANNGRHIEVTTAKKNEPPEMNTRRHFMGCLSGYATLTRPTRLIETVLHNHVVVKRDLTASTMATIRSLVTCSSKSHVTVPSSTARRN